MDQDQSCSNISDLEIVPIQSSALRNVLTVDVLSSEQEFSGDEGVTVFNKPGVKALVWQYFGVTDPDEKNFAVCKLCKAKVPTKGATTACVWNHLKVHHHSEYVTLNFGRQTSESESVSKRTKTDFGQVSIQTAFKKLEHYSRTSSKWKGLTDSVTYCMAKDSMPINTVERKGFKQMLQKFDPRYKLPGRTYFTQTALPRLEADLKKEIAGELSSVDYVAATVDLWSSVTMTPYMSVTSHFITPDWKMQSRALEALYLPESHTGSNISEAVKEVTDTWSITNKVVAFTTDRGSNMIAAGNLAQWTRVSCFGHILNNAITNAIEKNSRVGRVRAVSKRLVSVFSYWSRKQALKNAQIRLGLPAHQLITECNTRWGSLFLSLSRILEQEQAIREVLSGNRRWSAYLPTWQDFDVIRDVCKVLKPLANVTDALSGEKYVTISAVLPLLKLMKGALEEDEEDSQVSKNLKRFIQEYLEEVHKSQPRKLLFKATLLDPRFKDHVPMDELRQAKQELSVEAEIIANNITAPNEDESEEQSSQATTTAKKNVTLAELLCSIRGNGANKNPVFSVAEVTLKELDNYVAEYALDAAADPLEWWRNRQTCYRHLSRLARKYLCCCATSCASERLFSSAGQIVTPHRSCTLPERVNMLTFLSHNL